MTAIPHTIWTGQRAAGAALAITLLAGGATAPATAADAGTLEAAPSVLATGDDSLGQQGNGAAGSRLAPGQVGPADLDEVTGVASGRDHAYVLSADGSVLAWGANDKGQIGDGTLTGRTEPVPVAVSGVAAVEAGHYHGIVLKRDGTVWTWGFGATGQLGDGAAVNRRLPVQVNGLPGVAQVAAGRDNSYAVADDGTVLGWGDNTHGQVGDGTVVRRTTPTRVNGLSGVTEIAVGRDHVLALDADGRVWAWGDNLYGQVGDGSTVDRSTPGVVHDGPVRHIDAGAHHSIAVTADGTVLTWGRGYRGQLGSGGTANRTRPAPVAGLPPVVEVGDGRDTSFAVTSSGEVWAWGENGSGQLGDGTTIQRNVPVRVPGAQGTAVVQGGALHTVFFSPGAGANLPPTASFDESCSGLTCTFTSTSDDGDGTVVGIAWTFGDGQGATSPSVEHTFSGSGSWTVRLLVTDDAGATASVERVVTVKAPGSVEIEPAGASGRAGNAGTAQVTLPAGVAPGDQLVLVLSTNRAAVAPDPAAGGAWTRIQTATVASGDMRSFVWARTAVAGDAGRTVSVALDARSKYVLSAVAYRGARLSTSAARVETVTTASHRTPGVTATTGSWVLSYWSDKSSATTSWQAPGGSVERAELSAIGSGRVTSVLADSGPLTASSAGGLTATADAASAKAVMFSLVLVPSG